MPAIVAVTVLGIISAVYGEWRLAILAAFVDAALLGLGWVRRRKGPFEREPGDW
jgi:hypothetical protein